MGSPYFNVHDVAALARIALTEQEESLFQIQLEQILECIEQLKAVDVSDVEPTAHAAPIYNVFRKDEPIDGLTKTAALENAPRSSDGLFVVTKVVE
ncbi:Glutamyl-tRNA(Gln) amidotransferase subunit C [Candidatus Xiphinematobacter sp. Idaho Grape]|uniref:Asp-tRNA(Asn)/Glu-tRNA(Gln) amidotransferase subunit GatC n=1 Tax=Candidatus Xiphinematobacter sp. Idaho Grape TaxID=1704307 RepID=UPI0007066E97|nr:Asp-tRNA(Asn)/Glu-tRNA(Gln) amidotransferase subunit GatC [Candidatus Xiphinematobacter sp. Idaho Grape]ALJ56330.1 Glutamyl-tRNA(Gln) amidotransferase subunit C [Candidatus Xiphinematobacter sp. Idaho Grape]